MALENKRGILFIQPNIVSSFCLIFLLLASLRISLALSETTTSIKSISQTLLLRGTESWKAALSPRPPSPSPSKPFNNPPPRSPSNKLSSPALSPPPSPPKKPSPPVRHIFSPIRPTGICTCPDSNGLTCDTCADSRSGCTCQDGNCVSSSCFGRGDGYGCSNCTEEEDGDSCVCYQGVCQGFCAFTFLNQGLACNSCKKKKHGCYCSAKGLCQVTCTGLHGSEGTSCPSCDTANTDGCRCQNRTCVDFCQYSPGAPCYSCNSGFCSCINGTCIDQRRR